jgi:hypothetical protein
VLVGPSPSTNMINYVDTKSEGGGKGGGDTRLLSDEDFMANDKIDSSLCNNKHVDCRVYNLCSLSLSTFFTPFSPLINIWIISVGGGGG